MRYFLFSYTWTNNKEKSVGDGNIWMSTDTFPTNEFLKAKAKETVPPNSSVVIAGWNEFKTAEDYHNFIKIT